RGALASALSRSQGRGAGARDRRRAFVPRGEAMIEGVVVKDIVTHPDERGYFREIIRVDDAFFGEGFGQWNHTLMRAGVAKAWHVHKRQVDWWYVAAGVLKVALFDTRRESATYRKLMELFMGADQPAR